MNAVIPIALCCAIAGGCASARAPGDAASPSALADERGARCEREARVAGGTTPTYPTPGTTPRGDFSTDLDVNRQAYWHCMNEAREGR